MARSNPNCSETAQQLFKPVEHRLIDNRVVTYRDVCVHSFNMGDVEDPDLYAAQPIYEWQQTEEGQWVMEHSVDVPFWHRNVDPTTYGHRYSIIARLTESDQVYWTLKYKGTQQ